MRLLLQRWVTCQGLGGERRGGQIIKSNNTEQVSPPFFVPLWLLMPLRTEWAEAWYCLSGLNGECNGTAVGSALVERHSYMVHFNWHEQCYGEGLRMSQKSRRPYKETISRVETLLSVNPQCHLHRCTPVYIILIDHITTEHYHFCCFIGTAGRISAFCQVPAV